MNGRKRHLLVDTTGLVLHVVVHPANIADRDGAKLVLEPLHAVFPRLKHIWADTAYQGALEAWVAERLGWTLEIVKRPSRWVWVPAGVEPPPAPAGFQVLPRRWVVERTLAWLGRYRRLSKDYEFLPASVVALVYVAMSRLMLARLAKP